MFIDLLSKCFKTMISFFFFWEITYLNSTIISDFFLSLVPRRVGTGCRSCWLGEPSSSWGPACGVARGLRCCKVRYPVGFGRPGRSGTKPAKRVSRPLWGPPPRSCRPSGKRRRFAVRYCGAVRSAPGIAAGSSGANNTD